MMIINQLEIKACLFDMDGVLVDTAVYHYQAWKKLAQYLGFDFTLEQNEQLKGISRMDSLDKILAWGNVYKSDSEKLELATMKNKEYVAMISKMTQAEVLPGVIDFLEYLRNQAVKTAIGSASKNTDIILQQTGLASYFDAIVDGNLVSKSKPDPEVFEKGAALLGFSNQECVVFEDAFAGIQAANAANMLAIGIGESQILTNTPWVFEGFTDVRLLNFFKH